MIAATTSVCGILESLCGSAELPQVVPIEIAIPSSSLNDLKANDRAYAIATVRMHHTTFSNAGIRLKGMGGYRQIDKKASFALKFNEFTKGQKWNGLSRVLLNNCAQDASYVSEALCNGLFRDAGLPAPRTAFARASVNGSDRGVYSLVEAINEPFLKQEFGNSVGNLYEGVAKDVADGLEQDNGAPTDQSELRQLADVARITNVVERWRELQKVLDIDRFITFVATETLVWHWDGYAMNRSNYRIYSGPGRKMVLIPHGLDRTFREPQGSIWPEMTSVLVRGVLQTPDGRRLYRERFRSLATNLFHGDAMTRRLEELGAQVRAAFAMTNAAPGMAAGAPAEWETAFAVYKRQVLRRVDSIHAQLSLPEPVPPDFNAEGVAQLTDWSLNVDWEQADLSANTEALVIRLASPGAGSWRKRVFLDPGEYRLEAHVRTQNVVPLNDMQPPGAGVRTSGARRANTVVGDNDRVPVAHEFRVWAQTIELVLELRCASGEASFATDSLKLVKLSR